MQEHMEFRLANDHETSTSVLADLANSPDVAVRAAVARNPSSSNKTLLGLVGDKDAVVIEQLMENSSRMEEELVLNYCKDVSLELVEKNDAEFVLSLRTDSELNSYVSSVTPSLCEQEKWITNYKEREKIRTEFYFLVKNIDGKKIGTIRIYDLQPGIFCWGSWMVRSRGNVKAPFSSVLSMYEFAFYELGFEKCRFDVRNENSMVISFHKNMGATKVGSDELDTFFEYTLTQYESFKSKNRKLISKLMK
jgi:RimJ/RimL family protein N-acetyltransferase